MLIGERIEYRIRDVPILQGVDIRIGAGDFWGVIGPNGAGKSTLLRVLAGLVRPTGGRATYRGRDLRAIHERERARQMAYVSQNPPLGFGFTVRDIVEMGRYPHKGRLAPLGESDRRAVARALASTRLEGLVDRRLHELSGGERQRVLIARALAQEPRVLLLDEPTANLDIRFQFEILELARRLNRQESLTVAMAIHDLTHALRYCSHILALQGGVARACGPTAEVLDEKVIGSVFSVEGRIVDGIDGPRVEYAAPREASRA